MDFSFIVPSRGNWVDLKKMFDSFERTTKDKKNIEFLLAIDIGTGENVPELIKKEGYGFEIRCFYRPHSTWWSKDYFNFLADRTVGDNICPFNDDAFMHTNHWDDKVRKHIKDSGWSIYLLDIPDSARIKYNHQFPCFPVISRKGFVAIGYFFHEQVKVYPLDKIMFEMYLNAERIIKVDDVFIQHDHVVETDPSKSELIKVFIEQRDNGELNVDISKEVMILLKFGQRDYIKNKSKLDKIIEIIREK